jgi:hypothetical protein
MRLNLFSCWQVSCIVAVWTCRMQPGIGRKTEEAEREIQGIVIWSLFQEQLLVQVISTIAAVFSCSQNHVLLPT